MVISASRSQPLIEVVENHQVRARTTSHNARSKGDAGKAAYYISNDSNSLWDIHAALCFGTAIALLLLGSRVLG